MRIFNSDGSEPEMCGNGIRCLARFVADKDGSGPVTQRIHTLAGTLHFCALSICGSSSGADHNAMVYELMACDRCLEGHHGWTSTTLAFTLLHGIASQQNWASSITTYPRY